MASEFAIIQIELTKTHHFQITDFDINYWKSNNENLCKHLNMINVRKAIDEIILWDFDIKSLQKFMRKKIFKIYKNDEVDKKTTFYQFNNSFYNENPLIHKFVTFLTNEIQYYVDRIMIKELETTSNNENISK